MSAEPLPAKTAAPILAGLLDCEVTEHALRAMARKGRIACVRRGGRVLFPMAAILAFHEAWPTLRKHSKLRRRA